MSRSFPTFWLPPGLAGLPAATHPGELVVPGGERVPTLRPTLTPAHVERLATHLREQARRRLRPMNVAKIVQGLDAVAEEWLDPETEERRLAIDAISSASGFSRAMVAHALDLEFESSRGSHLERALRSEIGDPEALDRFVPDRHLGGSRRAYGPGLIGGVASSNIPGLPHLTVTRSLLVKSPCLIRTSRHEPLFLPLFARTLSRVAPDLGECLGVLDFDPADAPLENAFLGAIDHLIAYGGVSSLEGLRARLPPHATATWHGHRLGFALLTRESLANDLEELAGRVAYDFTLFDREACLSPQVCFVEEGAAVSAQEVASAVARSMKRWSERLPPSRVDVADRSRRAQARGTLELRAANGERVTILGGDRESGFTVVVEEVEELAPAPRGRWVRIAPLADADRLAAILERARSLLQVAALEAPSDRLEPISEMLAELGVTRITRPGLAGLPSMMWRHDGVACLGSLLRWTGREWTAPRDRI